MIKMDEDNIRRNMGDVMLEAMIRNSIGEDFVKRAVETFDGNQELNDGLEQAEIQHALELNKLESQLEVAPEEQTEQIKLKDYSALVGAYKEQYKDDLLTFWIHGSKGYGLFYEQSKEHFRYELMRLPQELFELVQQQENQFLIFEKLTQKIVALMERDDNVVNSIFDKRIEIKFNRKKRLLKDLNEKEIKRSFQKEFNGAEDYLAHRKSLLQQTGALSDFLEPIHQIYFAFAKQYQTLINKRTDRRNELIMQCVVSRDAEYLFS